MSVVAARRRAERLVNEQGAYGPTQVPAVNVKLLAARLGLRVVQMDLRTEQLSGMLVTQPGVPAAIVVHSGDERVRKRFTIAHEIGHYVLRHHERPGNQVLTDRTYTYRGPRASSGLDPIEIAANGFASSLLMPTSLMERVIRERQLDPTFDDDIKSLATAFDVSLQAMTIRLSSLRYF